MTWNAVGQAAGCREQNESEKSETSPNLGVGLPQFLTVGSVREQYFKRLNLVSTRRPSDFRCVAIRSAGYGEPDAVSNAVDCAKFRSRSHDAVIRIYDEVGNVIEGARARGAKAMAVDCPVAAGLSPLFVTVAVKVGHCCPRNRLRGG